MDPLDRLKEALLAFDRDEAKAAARAIVEQGLDPVAAMGVVTAALREVGEGFGRGDLFLPELVLSAKAAESALSPLEDEVRRTGRAVQSRGTVVVGTVCGDIHSVGKTMVNALLTANGFKTIDLGTDVATERFVAAVKEHDPDILALSALLTTTAPEQGKVMKALQEAGLRGQVKVMVGGSAITPEFAQEMGADGYGATAAEAVSVADELMAR
jgi:5-methyltetrahydrofolate--homocysteine methyltransferase